MKEKVYVFGIIVAQILIFLFLYLNLPHFYYPKQNIFLLDLIGIDFRFPTLLYPIFAIIGSLIFYQISKNFFPHKYSLIALCVFALNPWLGYLSIAQSFYVYLLLLFFIFIFMTINLKNNHLFQGLIYALLIVSSFWFMLMGFFYIVFMKIKKDKNIKLFSYFIFSFFTVILVCILKQDAFANIVKNEIRLFNDPGLLNNVNLFYGYASKYNLSILAKISENRYLFYTEKVFIKALSLVNLYPYFSENGKLLNFSFTPPLFLGLMIPFLIGLYEQLKKKLSVWHFVFPALLLLPALFSGIKIDTQKLIFVLPIFAILISFGFKSIGDMKNIKVKRLLLVVTLLLLVFQVLLTSYDIGNKEFKRYESVYGNNLILNQ